MDISEIQKRLNQLAEFRHLLNWSGKLKSQWLQDLFVLCVTGFKREGFFIEFGAHDGISGSNTYILEKDFGWRGIVAEPLRSCYPALIRNRSCHIDNRCVWEVSDAILPFKETKHNILSTLVGFENDGLHDRSEGSVYDVQTVSLLDLLTSYQAPKSIDYLSIDTEGTELNILRNFDFSKYNINIITCEHNHHNDKRIAISNLLDMNGYKRVFSSITEGDDWFVREN